MLLFYVARLYLLFKCWLHNTFKKDVEVILDSQKSCKSSTENSHGFSAQIHQFSIFCHFIFSPFLFPSFSLSLSLSFSSLSDMGMSVSLCTHTNIHTCIHTHENIVTEPFKLHTPCPFNKTFVYSSESWSLLTGVLIIFFYIILNLILYSDFPWLEILIHEGILTLAKLYIKKNWGQTLEIIYLSSHSHQVSELTPTNFANAFHFTKW